MKYLWNFQELSLKLPWNSSGAFGNALKILKPLKFYLKPPQTLLNPFWLSSSLTTHLPLAASALQSCTPASRHWEPLLQITCKPLLHYAYRPRPPPIHVRLKCGLVVSSSHVVVTRRICQIRKTDQDETSDGKPNRHHHHHHQGSSSSPQSSPDEHGDLWQKLNLLVLSASLRMHIMHREIEHVICVRSTAPPRRGTEIDGLDIV